MSDPSKNISPSKVAAFLKGFFVLPHWHMRGGAGYYIRDLIDSLKRAENVLVAGPYASDYSPEPVRTACLDKLTLQILPTYQGIRLSASLYHIVLSAFRALTVISLPRRKPCVTDPEALIFTSSVQATAVPIARLLFPKSCIVVLVQENVCLSRGLGRFTNYLLKRADIIVSITEAWAQHARDNGLLTMVLPNNYEPDYASRIEEISEATESDLLYVGGDAKIKGFDNLIAALPALLSVPGRRIICLGHYSEAACKRLERAQVNAHPDAELAIVGFVPDIRPYLQGTRLLILPIGSPHFCRPAIEAGLIGKTFVIPDFSDIRDFAVDGVNCTTFQASNIGDFVFKVSRMLDRPAMVSRLEEGNKAVAETFKKSPQNIDTLLQSIRNHTKQY